MNKHQFVNEIRQLCIQEPSREQWSSMWEIYQRNSSHSLEKIVDMVHGRKIVDNRIIPEQYRNTALSLEELAHFGKSMSEQFLCSKKKR